MTEGVVVSLPQERLVAAAVRTLARKHQLAFKRFAKYCQTQQGLGDNLRNRIRGVLGEKMFDILFEGNDRPTAKVQGFVIQTVWYSETRGFPLLRVVMGRKRQSARIYIYQKRDAARGTA